MGKRSSLIHPWIVRMVSTMNRIHKHYVNTIKGVLNPKGVSLRKGGKIVGVTATTLWIRQQLWVGNLFNGYFKFAVSNMDRLLKLRIRANSVIS